MDLGYGLHFTQGPPLYLLLAQTRWDMFQLNMRVSTGHAPFWRKVSHAPPGVFWKGLDRDIHTRRMVQEWGSNPDLSMALHTWAFSKFPWWTLAEEWSPAGLVAHTLHVLWTRLLHARIIRPRTHSSCGKGRRSMIRTLKDSAPTLWIIRNCQGLGFMWSQVSYKGATQKCALRWSTWGIGVHHRSLCLSAFLGPGRSRIRAKENPELILLGQNMPKFYLSQFQLKKDHRIDSARRYQRFPKS